MISFDLDSPDVSGMNEFLRYIYEIKKNNNIIITRDIVYHELDRFRMERKNLKPNRELIDIEQMFPAFTRNYLKGNASKNKYTYKTKYFLFFINDKDDEKEFIKLYIPFDKDYIYEDVNILLDFLNKENISHCSKVCKNIRNDDFIIRLKKGDVENAHKIINFINNNKKLKHGLLKVNPFVPTANGIGIMEEKGTSYNGDMSSYIADFIEKSYKHKTDVNAKEFIHYFNNACNDPDVKNVFYSNFISNNDNIVTKENNIDKRELLKKSIKVTYSKYGFSHVVKALQESLNNNFSYFSRGNEGINYRNLLIRNLNKDQIKKIIGVDDIKEIDKIEFFCKSQLKDELELQFEKICYVTASNYSVEQCISAIKCAITNQDYSSFSRYLRNGNDKTNYRELVKSYNKEEIIKIIKKSLLLESFDINMNDYELIDEYCNIIIKRYNKNYNEISR